MAEPTDTAPQDPARPLDRQDTAVQPTEHPTSENPTSEHPTSVQPTGSTSYPYGGWTETATTSEPAQVAAAPATKRSPDLVGLIAGILFCVVAVLGVVGTSLPGWVFGGGLVAVLLVVLGAGLLVAELRRVRRG